MAVLDSLPGLTVSVCVDGQALNEFEDDEAVVSSKPGVIGEYQAARTVTKYIEAMSDKEFTVKILLDTGYRMDCGSLGLPISVDGIWANEPLMSKSNTDVRGDLLLTPMTRVVEGSYVAAPGKPEEQFIKTFKFCKLETSNIMLSIFRRIQANILSAIDDNKLKDVKHDAEAVSKVGLIEVKVYRNGDKCPIPGIVPSDISASLQAEVHEKALKGQAKSHKITYVLSTISRHV